MAEVTPGAVKSLREKTGAGMMECKRALQESGGNEEQAIEILRKRGMASASKKAGRVAAEGVVGSYIHMGGKVGVLVEINCETDFVARTEEFQQLVHKLAVQVAATFPNWVDVDDIPADVVDAKRAELLDASDVRTKPADVRERIVDGRLRKWYAEPGGVLLEQPFRDTEQTIRDLITQGIATIGENIQVRRFERYALGE